MSLMLACIVFAFPQSQAQLNQRNELGLLLGAAVTPEIQVTEPIRSSVQIGSGITFQVTYARQLRRSRITAFHLEVPALSIPLQRITASNGSVPRNYDSFFITPALRVTFAPGRRLSLRFWAGGGYALFDESALRTDGNHNTTRGTSGGAIEFGAGANLRTPVKVQFPIRFRLEVRDFHTSKPTYNVSTGGAFQHNLVFSGGLVLHF